mmetsp:Transcript_123609/g.219025  ORF Transcript_123609/g.219025 Transcript_123609/m.219025 type:complete len:520 (+) Transcript_123609:105-1664(+)
MTWFFDLTVTDRPTGASKRTAAQLRPQTFSLTSLAAVRRPPSADASNGGSTPTVGGGRGASTGPSSGGNTPTARRQGDERTSGSGSPTKRHRHVAGEERSGCGSPSKSSRDQRSSCGSPAKSTRRGAGPSAETSQKSGSADAGPVIMNMSTPPLPPRQPSPTSSRPPMPPWYSTEASKVVADQRSSGKDLGKELSKELALLARVQSVPSACRNKAQAWRWGELADQCGSDAQKQRGSVNTKSASSRSSSAEAEGRVEGRAAGAEADWHKTLRTELPTGTAGTPRHTPRRWRQGGATIPDAPELLTARRRTALRRSFSEPKEFRSFREEEGRFAQRSTPAPTAMTALSSGAPRYHSPRRSPRRSPQGSPAASPQSSPTPAARRAMLLVQAPPLATEIRALTREGRSGCLRDASGQPGRSANLPRPGVDRPEVLTAHRVPGYVAAPNLARPDMPPTVTPAVASPLIESVAASPKLAPRPSPKMSPRSSPRASPRQSPRASPLRASPRASPARPLRHAIVWR